MDDDEMLIEFHARTVDNGRVFYKGTLYRVPREVGLDYVSVKGWASDCAGEVPCARPAVQMTEPKNVVLNVAHSRMGQRTRTK